MSRSLTILIDGVRLKAMALSKIISQYQNGNRFCTCYALTHALMIKTGGFINVWAVVGACFRYKMWPFLLNRSFSIPEAFDAIKTRGVTVEMPNGTRKRIYPTKLVRMTSPEQYIGNEPIIAMINQDHTIVITGECGINYETLDSQVKGGYIIRPKDIFKSPFYLIVI